MTENSPVALRLRRGLRSSRVAQIALIALMWATGEGLTRLTELPLPGGVVGMMLALALLASGRLSLLSMRRGAQWYIAEMLLFFIPAVLALVDHREFLGLLGLKILIVILVGTVVVMCTTALAVDFGYRLIVRRENANAAVD